MIICEIDNERDEQEENDENICFICYEDLSENILFEKECHCSFNVCKKCADNLISIDNFNNYVCPQCKKETKIKNNNFFNRCKNCIYNRIISNCVVDCIIWLMLFIIIIIIIKDIIEGGIN